MKKIRYKATMFGHKHLDPVTARGKITVASANTDLSLFLSEEDRNLVGMNYEDYKRMEEKKQPKPEKNKRAMGLSEDAKKKLGL